MTHDWARREIGKTAKAMLSGATSFIEGARTLAGLRFSAGLERDPDLTVFVAIDSETDALPMGDVRKLYEQSCGHRPALFYRAPAYVDSRAMARDTH